MRDPALGRALAAIRARLDLNWNRFFVEFQKDVKLWGFCVLFLGLFRVLFILCFAREIDDASTWTTFLGTFLNGFLYDSMVGGYLILVPFLMGVASGFIDLGRAADRTRGVFAIVFVVSSTILCCVTLGFYEEFGDVFNHWVFGLWYADTGAVLATIWKEYNLVLNLVVAGVVIAACIVALRFLLQKPFVSEDLFDKYASTPARKAAATVVIVLLLVIAGRGSIGFEPVKLKDAAATRDPFLNKVVVNPFLALKYAINRHLRLSRSSGLKTFLPDGDISEAAKYVFGRDDDLGDLDAYMLRHAAGTPNPARHVFVIIMESFDSWPFLEQYRSLKLTGRLGALADRGLHFKSFLPATGGTMASLCVIIVGFPDPGVRMNFRKSSGKPYPSSIAEQFGRLGYRTRLFYGNRLSCHGVGDFGRNQGFDEVYGQAHVGYWKSGNAWGVDDEHLFDFVVGKVDDDRPSLNVILTTTYHPPYDVDVYGKGYPVREIPDELRPVFDGDVDLKVFGHRWYSDLCLGEFVERMEKKLSSPLFAITGDHYGRRHVRSKPDFFERSAVPLVLYGPDVLEGLHPPEGAVGSHIDIVATMIELAAPTGFPYYSVGENLLAPRRWPYGIGGGKVIAADFMVEIGDELTVHPVPHRKLPEDLPDLQEVKRLYDAVHAVAWWRIMRGPTIEGSKGTHNDGADMGKRGR